MTKRWILNFLFMALGAFVLLLVLNLAGFGPALVRHEKVRVVLPPQRRAQPAQLASTVPKPQVTTPAPPSSSAAIVPPVVVLPVVVQPVVVQPSVVIPPNTVVPAPPPQATSWLIITGQPQIYTDNWGYQWVIDSNGNFNCPSVDYVTQWVPGYEVWVYHLSHPKRGWYTTWAPACYR